MAWNVEASTDELALLMEAGLIYRDARRFDDAAAVFQGVRALAPKSDVPEIALGTLEFERGDLARAVTHYQAALRLNAASAYAHSHLAEAHLIRRDHGAARDHIRQAIELDPRGETGRFARSLSEWIAMVEKTVEKTVEKAGEQATGKTL